LFFRFFGDNVDKIFNVGIKNGCKIGEDSEKKRRKTAYLGSGKYGL
jgi:hypothetical protein